ncbi:hypothetical protein SLA2020_346850 [Shorea laevis]
MDDCDRTGPLNEQNAMNATQHGTDPGINILGSVVILQGLKLGQHSNFCSPESTSAVLSFNSCELVFGM